MPRRRWHYNVRITSNRRLVNNKIIMQYIKYTTCVVITVLSIDFIGFIAWIASGQLPVSDWYIGMITASIIRLFIS